MFEVADFVSLILYLPRTRVPFNPWADPEGEGTGDPPPWKIKKNIGFPSNIDPDPTKLPSQDSMVGHYRHASATPLSARQRNAISMAFRWRVDDGPR